MDNPLVVIVIALLGSGLFGAVASVVTSRALARKTDVETDALTAKLPAEVDSIAIQGAEAAVLSLKSALDAANAQIADLRQAERISREQREADHLRIAELEAKVRTLTNEVDQVNRTASELQRELGEFVSERKQRNDGA